MYLLWLYIFALSTATDARRARSRITRTSSSSNLRPLNEARAIAPSMRPRATIGATTASRPGHSRTAARYSASADHSSRIASSIARTC